MPSDSTVYMIAGIVSGVVALNITLLFAWLFLRPRRKQTLRMVVEDPPMKGISASNITLPRPPLPASLPIPVPSRPADHRPITSVPSSPTVQDKLPHSLSRLPYPRQSDRFTSVPRRASRSTDKRRSKPHVLRSVTNLSENNYSQTSLKRGPSVRSVADSESMYSVASAPMDMHDRVFKPMVTTLESIPASPDAESFSAQNRERTRSLASAMYVSSPATDSQLHGPPNPIAVSPVPYSDSPHFLITPPSPVAPLSIEKHDPSSPVSSPVSRLPLTSPFTDPSDLPRPPPRSPLRHVTNH